MKGKLLVNVPPLPSAPVGALGPPPPKPEPKRFGVDVHPDDTFQDIWPRIDANFKRLYPHEYPYFSIKKLQALGCDVAYDEKVGDWFDEETDRSKKVVDVVRAPVDRNISVAPTSFLRPPNLLKRSHLAAIDENSKRRRIDEEQYGFAVEDMVPDRPIRSREQDAEALQLDSRPASRADSDVVVVADSQREAVPLGAPRDATSTKTESPDRTSLMDVPEAAPGPVAAEANGLHSNPDSGAFRKPGLPASASKDTAGAQSVRRGATPRRRKKSVPIPPFPRMPPWHPSPSPSSRSRWESPSEPAPYPLPSSQQPERPREQDVEEGSFETAQGDDGPNTVHVARTPTPTQPDSLEQAPSFIPPGGRVPSSEPIREPSPMVGTPPSAQRPPRSPDISRSQASATKSIPDDQATKSLEQRRHHRVEPPSHPALSSPAQRSADRKDGARAANEHGLRSRRSRKNTGVIEGEEVVETNYTTRKAEEFRRNSDQLRASTMSFQTESNAEALKKLKGLNDGNKIYVGRSAAYSQLEDEVLLLGRQAGLTFIEIKEQYLPNRTYKSLYNRYKRLPGRGDNVSQISEPSIDTAPRTHSDQTGSSPHDPKDSRSSLRKQSSSSLKTSRKDSLSSQKQRSSPEIRIPPTPSQLARKSDGLPVQTSLQPQLTRKGEPMPLTHPSGNSDSQKPRSSEDVAAELERLEQKYVNKQAQKAEAERKKEACLQRQIKAKRFRDLVDISRKEERRRNEREAREKKEVARQRQRRHGLVPIQQIAQTGPDYGDPQSDWFGSSSENEAPLSRLRPGHTTRSAPSVSSEADERQPVTNHAKQPQSSPRDSLEGGATISQVKDSAVLDKQAAKPEAEPIAETMESGVAPAVGTIVPHGQTNRGKRYDSDSTSDDESITSPEPEAEPTAVGASSTRSKRPTVRPPEFQSEELGHDLNPANFVPSSPSEAFDADDAPPSSPPVMHDPPGEDGLPSPRESSSSDSESSSASDSEASSEVEGEHVHGKGAAKTNGVILDSVESNGFKTQPSTEKSPEIKQTPPPPAVAPPVPKSPAARFRDPRLKSLSELKANMKNAPIPKPVVKAPPKKVEPAVGSSSSDDDSSTSDSSTNTDSSVERRRKAKSAKRRRKGVMGLMKYMAS